jgi:poly(A) polymerase
MATIIDQPWMTAPETRSVVRALTRDGTGIRFVGGCVRDALAGRTVADIDIATPDPPETILRHLDAEGIRAIPTGIDHGTITAVVDDRLFEITTLRVDVETDGRRAVVAFTDDWTADAARRDLTINAMSCSVEGRLYDPFGGADDLAVGRIRFVGNAEQRIREDVLRLLRFFRFFAHYGQPPLDEEGLAACRLLADRLPTLSGERVQAEIFSLLAADTAADVLAVMAAEAVLAYILPEATEFDRLRRLIGIERDTGVVPRMVRRLAAVLATAATDVDGIARRLKLSGADRDYLRVATVDLPRFQPIADEAARRRWFYRRGAEIYRELLLLWAAGRAEPPSDLSDQLGDTGQWLRPIFPLSGEDVLDRGVPSGPRIGESLRAVEDWWIDNDFVPTRKACLARLHAHLDSFVAGDDPGPA